MENAKSGIYGIVNCNNGNWYIGQSKNIYKRLTEHKSALRKNAHVNKKLQNAFVKYGSKSFAFVELQETNNYLLNETEGWWIKYFKSNLRGFGYNLDSGGGSGKLFTKEALKKMSEKSKGVKNGMYGKTHTPETRKKIAEARKNNPITKETKDKISLSNTGKIRSEETKQKMSEAALKRWKKSDHWKKQLSQKMMGNKYGIKNKGRTYSQETIKKMSEGQRMVQQKKKILLLVKNASIN